MTRTPLLLSLLLGLTACKKNGGEEPRGHAGMDMPPDAAAASPHAHGQLPEGHAEVTLAPDRQQLLGVRTARAERATLGGAIRATAVIQADEKRQAHVHSKLMGWIQDLYVNAVGQRVKKGQPLYRIYSQDLLAAQQEFLRARGVSPDLADAARERMTLWDIPADQIAEIERTGKPIRAVIVRAPIAGTVIEKEISKGHYVEPGMMLYLLADLSQVWVIADVYESELSRLDRKGQARIAVEGLPAPLTGAIDYVYPTVDTASRTVKVRLVVDNPRGDLRPGNFATVELPIISGDAVWVPEEAVIDTGTQKVAYLALPQGRFRPVEVKTGRRADGKVEILAGLEAGADVVVGAQFLLDSESRLRGSATPGAGHGGGH